MRVRLWGTRGSIATPGPSTVRYGGNTVCVELRSDSGSIVVLDCGTGARLLGKALADERRASGDRTRRSLLIGHTHWDHIQGLPFFAPLFDDGSTWDIYGPRGLGESLAQTLAGQMQYKYFPVTLEQLTAQVAFHDLVEGSFEIGDLCVSTQYLNHPALTLGYRIEGDGVTVVYACDHEPFDPALAAGGDVASSRGDSRHAQFLAGADLVIHDAQYRPDEYPARRGWGHSTAEYAVAVAAAAEVGTLVLSHHDPDHGDDAVDAILAAARAAAHATGFTGTVLAAAEGDTIDVHRSAPAARTGAGNGRPASSSAVYVPATADLSACIVLAATDPAVRNAVRVAVAEEQLPLVEDETDLGENQNAVVVLDRDDPSSVRATLGNRIADRVVVALTRGRPEWDNDADVVDWLVWPSSVGHIRTKLRAALLRRACRWQSAPLPVDEPERLRALRRLNLLDTAPEERFDRFTRDACAAFNVPFATVTLVDEHRQWFKSRRGIDATETPRDQSVCAHAILADDVLVVPDLAADDRFAENPAIAGTGLRFYAGAPLVLRDGSRVGTLCIGGVEPRVLTADELAELRRLADGVRGEMERAEMRGDEMDGRAAG
jgi:phosphoribosyl 1,2-cyclic phosphodiesterase